jgi:hypothetical protein
MHVHAGLMEALTTFAYIIIFGFFWRTLTIKWADKPIGKGMAYIYG